MLRATTASFAALLFLGASGANSQSFGSLHLSPGQTMTYQQAKFYLPRLTEVTFEKADADGDGVIDARELPVLQSIYEQLYLDG
jgi:hypothetical protein